MANYNQSGKFTYSLNYLIIILLFVSSYGILLTFCNENNIEKIEHHVQKHGASQNENNVHLGHEHGKHKINSLAMKIDSDGTGTGTGTGTANAHMVQTSSLNDINHHNNNNENENDREDENDTDYENYDSIESNNHQNGLNEFGKDFSDKDLNEIKEDEKEDEFEEQEEGVWSFSGPRKIGKCCPLDQSLNSQGMCKKLSHTNDKSHHHHNEVSWFPDKVFDVQIGNWTIPNQSEWEITSPFLIKCPPNESSEIIFDINRFVVMNNGRLFLSHHDKDLAPLNFCLDLLIGHGRAVKSCFTKAELCGKESNCLRKCCPEKAMVQEPSGSCVVSPHNVQKNFPKDKYNIIHGSPSCPFGQYVTEVNEFKIGDDGGLIAISSNNSINATFLEYCLDFFTKTEAVKRMTENIDDEPTDNNYAKYNPTLKAMICFESFEDRNMNRNNNNGLIIIPKGVGIVFGSGLILSAICIAMAAFVSWRLAELRSLHGKCQLSHLATLFCLCIMLATVHLASDALLPGPFCTFFAVAIHMCALSAFLWLNLLCVNIYLTFRYLRPPLAARRDENKRLFFLCVYAWGIPASFCLFLFILDSTPGRMEPMPRPGYGEMSCLISNRAAQFTYLYGPVGILLLLNGILFCLTAKELLCGLWRLDNSDSISFRRKSMGIVVGKMGIVMGMGWILDVLSWGVGTQFPYMFYASDLFNALQGVFIFLVLIWRKRVLEILHLRKTSIIKDDTITAARPFLPKRSLNTTMSNNGDADTSLVLIHDS